MQGEYLNIETVKKIARLERENKKLSDMISKFDSEINRQWKTINDAYEYLCLHCSVENTGTEFLKALLNQAINFNEESSRI